ncbi:zinc ribbon domain-containing protein [Micromonospora sp. CPCC 205547]|uniref:zinc ribbon domain-containing protein n=1 Tax=Micromonospora sp. CPCC 205547 TaxID=3122400 RepID=UPI003B9692F2
MKTIQAYRFALDLTPVQQRAVLAHAGAARVAHNWALARVRAVMDQRPPSAPTVCLKIGSPPPRRRHCRRCARRGTRRRPTSRRGGPSARRRHSTPASTLARHIADAAFAEFRRQLAYKTTWNGGRLLTANRWYPSSKTCSGCGAAKAKLALSEREYECESCALVLDRDVNAARNLAALAAEHDTAGSGPVAGCGADRKTRPGGPVAVKRQPGTALTGKTGTVPPQGGTADHVLTRAH